MVKDHMSKVLIDPATYENVRQAIDRAFEIFPQNIQGKKVLIKPTFLAPLDLKKASSRTPEFRAVVEKVETMRPVSIIVGDNPGVFSYGRTKKLSGQRGSWMRQKAIT